VEIDTQYLTCKPMGSNEAYDINDVCVVLVLQNRY